MSTEVCNIRVYLNDGSSLLFENVLAPHVHEGGMLFLRVSDDHFTAVFNHGGWVWFEIEDDANFDDEWEGA